MSTQITIIGLDRVGLSFGLALKKAKNPAECIGFDLDSSRIKTAEKIQAVDRGISNLHAAVENADLVLVNLPAGDVVNWMKDVVRSLKDGAVLINLAPVHSHAYQWAASHIPSGRNFINATPAINGSFLETNDYSADLFKDGILLISALPGTDASAIQLVVDMAAILGATVMFSDPVEADGLLSQTDLLPRLVSLLYWQGISDQPGWPEAQKTTGSAFWRFTQSFEDLPTSKSLAGEILAQKENMLRMLEMLRGQIDHLQAEIESGDPDLLENSIQKAMDDHDQWVNRRTSGNWNSQDSRSAKQSVGIWKKLLGIDSSKKKS